MTTIAKDLKPGMVIRSASPIRNPLTPYRQVAEIHRPTPYAERFITFTDGTTARVGNCQEFQVASSAVLPTVLDVAALLFGAYVAAVPSSPERAA